MRLDALFSGLSGDDRRAGRLGGDEGTRTPDPLVANQMLYQLSYVPKKEPPGIRAGSNGPFSYSVQTIVTR